MTSSNIGATLGGVAGARDRRKTRELESRRLDIAERQAGAEQQAEMLQSVRERFAGLSEQAAGIVSNIPVGRDDPRFQEAIRPLREALATLAARAEQNFPGSVSAQSQLALFDSAIASTPTILEAAEAEAEATVAGATAQASAIQSLAPEQQAQVRDILGLGDDARAQEFFGLLEILEDPNASPLAKEKAGERMEAITNNAGSQLVVTADGEGNIRIIQGPGAATVPQRATLTGSQLDSIRAQKNVIGRGVELVDAIVANPAPLGATGDIRSFSEKTSGAISDVFGIPADQLTQQFESLVNLVPHDDPETFAISELDAAEGFLMFAYARALQPTGERILTGTLETARAATNLGGITSDDLVRKRLQAIGGFLRSADADLQRRLEQGTGGTATTPTEPLIPPRTEAPGSPGITPEIQELIDELDRVLGDG